MKNSAWYHKLWRKKLDELPVKEDVNAAWQLMQQQLDAHLPVSNAVGGGGGVVKPLISKIITMVGYVLPAAAMVGVGSYLAVTTGTQHKKDINKSKKIAYHKVSSSDSVTKTYLSENLTDSLEQQNSIVPDTTGQAVAGVRIDSIDHTQSALPSNRGNVTALNGSAQSQLKSELHKRNNQPNNPEINAANVGRHSRINNNMFSNGAKLTPSGYNASGGHENSVTGSMSKRRGAKPQKSNSKEIINEQLVVYGSQVLQPGIAQVVSQNYNRKDYIPTPQYIANKIDLGHESFADRIVAVKQKTGNAKIPKASKSRAGIELITPAYNYGLQAGVTISKGNTGFYLGATGSYALSKRWLAEGAVFYNSSQTVSGNFSRPSYYRPDSAAALSLTDSRKVRPIDVLLNVQYKVNGLVSLKAGPVLSFAGKQTNISTKLGAVGSIRDTIGRGSTIDSVGNTTVLTNKVSLGLSTGIGINLKHFNIDARYLWLPAYKVNNSWGTYSQPANRWQIGISYLFKTK